MAPRPVVLVDMDGPLAGFDQWYWHKCRQKGFHFDCLESEQTHRFASDHIPDRAQRKASRQMIDSDPNWFFDLPVVDGAFAGMHSLLELADVWICTKPLESNPWCRDSKAAWLRHHFGKFWEHRLIITPDKSKVHGLVLLDDAIKLDWIPSATWTPVVFPMSWNGAGSPWSGLPRWGWGDDPHELLDHGYPF